MDFALGYNPTSTVSKEDYKVLVFRWSGPKHILFRDADPAYARLLVKYSPANVHLGDDSQVLHHYPSSIDLYTLSTGRWRNIWPASIYDNATAHGGGVNAYGRSWWWHLMPEHMFVNGVIYWIGLDKRIYDTNAGFETSRIIPLDECREVFKWNVELPYNCADPRDKCDLGVMADSTLAFLAHFNTHISIWLMDQSSPAAATDGRDLYPWTKLCTISVHNPDDSMVPRPRMIMTRSEELLVFQSGIMTSYDVKRRQVKNVYQREKGTVCIVGEYVDSLALLTKGKPDDEEKEVLEIGSCYRIEYD